MGLDTDITKIPPHLLEEEDPIFAFNKAIIEATHRFTVAYKPNTAFYEAHGEIGWRALKKTIDYLNRHHPDIFTIADAKRGDIAESATPTESAAETTATTPIFLPLPMLNAEI